MALGNIRDKLLKAGLVDKKQKQQADTQDRRDKKQKSADQHIADDEERKRQFAERQATEAAAQRQQEEERAVERAVHEQRNRVSNICDRWAVRSQKPGQRRFYYVKRSRFIGHLLINDGLCDQLLLGSLVIVERQPDDDAHVLLPPDAAERVQAIDPVAVRFWARSKEPIGYVAEPAG
jgi:uncharacterized protein YaiL (DUF2058 family)